LQQVAAADAQSLVVSASADARALQRSSYSATTAAEVEAKHEAAAAAERARVLAEQARASAAAAPAASKLASLDLSMTAQGSGEVRWPVTGFHVTDRVGARGGAHMGTDMLAPAMTPIFATAAGTVRISQESYGGYGVAVVLDHAIAGQRVTSVYGHMTYGTRQVTAGQTVEAGQLIGFVGSTGRSTANHLHFEIWVSGGVVDSLAWLEANAS
jgi:murein DD-endopeptidase MepM/ murein hydrolase activator NlpD